MRRAITLSVFALFCSFCITCINGAIAQSQNTFQPVELQFPDGTEVSFAIESGAMNFGIVESGFANTLRSSGTYGLLVGPVYQLQISQIPYHPGRQLYPTLQILDTVAPAPGASSSFPIQISITPEDLELVFNGSFVTRVIYLENAETALPVRSDDSILSQDVGRGVNPLWVAQTLGRPVAVIRIGSRIPDSQLILQNITLNRTKPVPPVWHLSSSQLPVPADSQPNVIRQVGMQEEFNLFDHSNYLQPNDFQVGLNDWTDRLTIDPSLQHQPFTRSANRATQDAKTQRQAGRPNSEYLFDGGDKGHKTAFRRDLLVEGIEARDTVIAYESRNGKKIIQPSNRVAIYSPRFGSIRQVASISVNEQRTLASAANGHIPIQNNSGTQKLGVTGQETGTNYTRNRIQIEGTQGRTLRTSVSSQKSLDEYKQLQTPTGFSNLLQQSQLDQSVHLRLMQGKMNTQSWGGTQGLLIRVGSITLKEMTMQESPHVLYAIDDSASFQEGIRFLKVASTDSAVPGEIVEFTLRFENTGNTDLNRISIIDSLTSRLEFLPDSAKSSHPAQFYVEPNETGSFLLRWDLTIPLPSREFGVITFQCKVR